MNQKFITLMEKKMISFDNGIWVGISVDEESQNKLYKIVKRYSPDDVKLAKPDSYHVTVAYSRNKPKGKYEPKNDSYSGTIEDLFIWDSDEHKIVVAKLKSKSLSEYWKELKDEHGLDWDFPTYNPHITLMSGKDISKKSIEKLKDHLLDIPVILQGEQAEELDPDKPDVE